jgi:hypothetical protein
MPERALPRTSPLRWSPVLVGALLVGLGIGAIARILLWPTPGLTGDLDQFVLWVHGIAVGSFSHAYDQNLSFPPVMAYIWGRSPFSNRHSGRQRPRQTPRSAR